MLQAFDAPWGIWAGEPEVGVIVDRAKSFLGEFSAHMTQSGCRFDTAAKAAPWHIAKVERHGDPWQGMLRRVVWGKQVAGYSDMLAAATEVTRAKNSLTRRSGFSPSQWVLGRDIRLPADLMDDSEVARISSLAELRRLRRGLHARQHSGKLPEKHTPRWRTATQFAEPSSGR